MGDDGDIACLRWHCGFMAVLDGLVMSMMVVRADDKSDVLYFLC